VSSENDGGVSIAASAGERGAERGGSRGVSQLAECIGKARAEGRAALIAYLPVGYPTVDDSITAMVAAVEAGADVIEVGVPYSDPGMDGPVIQEAVDLAVRAGVGMRDVLRAVRAVADAGAVAVVMTYWNPVERYGVDRFATDLAAAGGAGAITPDLIPEEAGEWIAAAEQADLDRVFLVAPSSTDARLRSTTAAGRGFVYAASTMGVTGTRATVSDAAQKLVARTREARPDLPVCVGLGVSSGAQAAEIAAFADGVIVGSAYVRELLEGRGTEGVRALTADLAEGVRA
jgi:tryptophan synthase alpha chain